MMYHGERTRAGGYESRPAWVVRVAVGSASLTAVVVACSQPAPEKHEQTEQQVQGVSACSHPICTTGGPLIASCDPCVANICALDPYCCQWSWDATCVGEVKSICGQSCAPPPPSGGGGAGANTCAHPLCSTGGPLASTCDPCVTKLCAADPYCCMWGWDATCVGEVTSICGQPCQ
jgi:hypothetical protein